MDLDVRQDDAFQQKEWRVQRVGWSLMALFVLAGLLGVFGVGPLTSATTSSADGVVTVEHDRVARLEADNSLTLTFGADAIEDGMITVEVTGTWPAGVDLQGVTPEPAEQRALPDGVVWEIPVERPGEIDVTLTFRAQELGTIGADVTVGDETATFTQLVLP